MYVIVILTGRACPYACGHLCLTLFRRNLNKPKISSNEEDRLVSTTIGGKRSTTTEQGKALSKHTKHTTK